MRKGKIENRYGKNVLIDEVTGKVKLAESLGLNTPFSSNNKILQEMEDIKYKYSAEQLERTKQLQAERTAKIKEKYEKWLKDESILDNFENIIVATDNHVVISVFYYQELSDLKTTEGGIIIADAIDNSSLSSIHKILPVARVVAANSDLFKIGDIVAIPAVMSKTKISDEWLQWQKDIREQPTLQKEELLTPPMYTGMLSQWGQYIFQANPWDSIDNPEVQHTFCIPERLIQAIIQK